MTGEVEFLHVEYDAARCRGDREIAAIGLIDDRLVERLIRGKIIEVE